MSVGSGWSNFDTSTNNQFTAMESRIAGTDVTISGTGAFTLGNTAGNGGFQLAFLPAHNTIQPNKLRPAAFKPGLAR
jgi:hypothetical protein